MTTNATFEKILIAPCGMNCGTCMAYQRDKNHELTTLNNQQIKLKKSLF